MSSSVYRQVLLFKSSFKRSIFTLVELLNISLQGMEWNGMEWNGMECRELEDKHTCPLYIAFIAVGSDVSIQRRRWQPLSVHL